jgi:hypothetical protein
MHRAALSYSARKTTSGSFGAVAAVVNRRSTPAQRGQPRVTGRKRR